MEVNFTWRKDKQNSKGIAPIYLDLRINKKRLRIPTGIRSAKKEDSRTKIEKGEILKRIETLEIECRNKDVAITEEMIRMALKAKDKVTNKTFFEFWDQWTEESKTRISDVTGEPISKGTISRYTSLKKKLKRFEVEKKYLITVETMNESFYAKFSSYVISDLKQSVNTFSDNVKNIKTFCSWLKKRNPDLNSDFEDFKKSFHYSDAEPLEPDELIRLYDIEFDGHKEKARLIFLFLCCTGMRISDYNSIKETLIKDDVIIHVTKKTNKKFYVPYFDDLQFRPVYVMDQMKKKYGGFPVISGQKLNDYIEIVAQEAKISRIKPTSKTGRKTFATIKLLNGVLPEIIMMSTGHKNRRDFDSYVGISTRNIIKEYKDKAVNLKVG